MDFRIREPLLQRWNGLGCPEGVAKPMARDHSNPARLFRHAFFTPELSKACQHRINNFL